MSRMIPRIPRPGAAIRHPRLGPILLVFVGTLAIGCSREEGSATTDHEPAPNSAVSSLGDRDPARSESPGVAFHDESLSAVSTERVATIPLNVLPLPNDELAEAATFTWESETLGALAASRLKALGKVMSPPSAIHQEAVAQLLSEGFRCGLLRPSNLEVVFQDTTFSVHRPSETDKSDAAQAPLRGAAGLARALRQLTESFEKADELRVEQKVVRVEVDQFDVQTRSLVHIIGRSSGTRVQQNMVWDCRWKRSISGKLELSRVDVRDFEEVRATLGGNSAFADCTEAALGASSSYRDVLAYGLDHWLDRIEARFGIFPTGWHGVAIGDANGDGRDDVYVCQPGGLPNALFLQSPDGTATDVATDAGVDLRDHTHSALFVDLDNDGDQDLVLATLVGILIFSNEENERFLHRATKLTPEGMPFSLSAADYDNDGDLDLYVCCYSKRRGTGSKQFVGLEGRPVPYHDANNGARNLLLRNNLGWQFQDVTRRAGLGQNNQRFSFAAAWEDYDNDGDQDLYVANDYGRNNLYRNQGGSFTDVADAASVEDISAGMSVSWGDVDNDGWMDLYVANMFSSAGNRVTYQRRFQESADAATRADFQRHARGNSLFTNTGSGTFRDVSESAAVTMGRWAWGSPLADLNNDGLKDIVVANGFITQELPDDL